MISHAKEWFNTLSFRWKAILFIATIEGLFNIMFAFIVVGVMQSILEEQFFKRAEITAQIFAATTANAVLATDIASLVSFIDEVMKNEDVIYARVRNTTDVLAERSQDPIYLTRQFKFDTNVSWVDDNVFDTFSVIQIDGENYGQVEVGLSTNLMGSTIKLIQLKVILIGAGEILFSAFVSFLLGSFLVRRLNDLQAGSHRMAAGEIGVRIDAIGQDELAETAQAFNHMSKTIEELIEDLRARQNALHKANDLAQQYLDVSPALYVSLDDKGTITTINQKAGELLGYEAHELLNKNWFELMVPKNNQTRVLEAFKNLISGDIKPINNFENKLVVRSGEERLFTIHLTPIYKTPSNEEDRSITGVLFVAEDITNRRTSEAALRQSQKMEAVGQLTGGIAHDFNNMLGIIMGNLELLRGKVNDDPNVIKHLDAAYAGGERGAKITKKLLSFSRHASEDQTLVNVNELIDGMTDLIGKSLTPKITIETCLADDICAFNIHLGDFEDTLLNLAINAGDAMPGGGTLVIETKNKTLDDQYVQLNPGCAVGDYVLISISDTGIGMEPDVVEQVFQPFFTTKEMGKGTGLGLSMVYGFIQRSKGHVKIYSKPGRGTTVRLYLPRIDQGTVEAEQITSNRAAGLPVGKETILVVDDEQGLADVAMAHLEDLGYTTLAAQSGQQALEVLQEHSQINLLFPDVQIDLLFSDVVMPGELDGYELAKKTTRLYPSVKVLLTSGFTFKREAAISRDIPLYKKLTNDLLNKPYNQTELAQAVRNILDKED
jgi:PAS domain S-box-containing protein